MFSFKSLQSLHSLEPLSSCFPGSVWSHRQCPSRSLRPSHRPDSDGPVIRSTRVCLTVRCCDVTRQAFDYRQPTPSLS
eukprot:756363-Hanusia_phi.AAC.1